MFWYNTYRNLGVLSLFVLILFSPYLIFYDTVPLRDWGYFNGLSYFINLSILHYHQLPLYDPYICGGMDVLTNPQSYIFSPLILLNFIFNPYLANLFSLMICAVIGGFSMIKLLNYFSVKEKDSLIGALIFLSSNWFALHFLEGHIAFRSLYLAPLAVYFIFNLEKHIKYFLYFSLLMGFFLLDGGIYSFSFSLFFLFIAICLRRPSLKALLHIIKNNILEFLFISLAFLLLVTPKVLPVILLHANQKAELHFFAYSIKDIWFSFFYPFNKITDSRVADDLFKTGYRMHEYVCYLGFFWIIPAALMILKKEKLSDTKTLFAFLLIFLWIGIGFGWFLNPWSLFMSIPFLHNSHIQSRFLIFFWIFFVIILTKILANSKNKNLYSLLILLELVLVNLFPTFVELKNSPKSSTYSDLQNFEKANIIETVSYIAKPEIYFTKNKTSKACYDKAKPQSVVMASDEPEYRGEFYSLSGKGKLILKERSLDKISASFAGEIGEIFIFNSNYLLGWESADNKAYEVMPINGLLAVKFNQTNAEMSVKYQPPYLKFILFSFLLAVIFYGILFKKIHELK